MRTFEAYIKNFTQQSKRKKKLPNQRKRITFEASVRRLLQRKRRRMMKKKYAANTNRLTHCRRIFVGGRLPKQ